eukprot:COSAG05_NODE_10280_length_573_cov_4.107143_2_plen_56_part_01
MTILGSVSLGLTDVRLQNVRMHACRTRACSIQMARVIDLKSTYCFCAHMHEIIKCF